MKLHIYLSVFLLSLFSTAARAQVLSYEDELIPVDFVPVDAAAGSVILSTAGEDEVFPVPIPFTFNFFGALQTQAFVSVNGNISFGQSYQGLDFNREALCFPVTSLYAPEREQDAANPDNFIAVAWDDFFIDPACVPASGMPSLSFTLQGTAPNQVLVVTWFNVGRSGDLNCAADDPGTFIQAQAKLFEGTDIIEIHHAYNRLTEQRMTVGVENADATYANYVRCGEGQDTFDKLEAWRFTPSAEEDPGNVQPPQTGYCEAKGEEPCSEGFGTIGEFTYGDQTFIEEGCEEFTADPTTYNFNTDVILEYTLGTNVDFSGTINNDLFTDQAAIWIDWNIDTVFAEDEIVLAAGEGTTFMGTIMDPAGPVQAGITRLRLRTYNSPVCLNTPSPCGNSTCGGEVQDYLLRIIDPANPAPDCPIFAQPTAGQMNLCQTTEIVWNQPANVAADSFRVFIQAPGQPKREFFQSDTSFTNTTPYPTGEEIAVVVNAFTNGQSSASCDTLKFTIAPDPDPVVDIRPTGAEIFSCVNSNLPLFGVTGYPSNITHNWSGPANVFLSATDIENPVFNSSVETSLKLFYAADNDFGCGGIDSTVVTVLDGARLDDYSFPTTEICMGDTAVALVTGAIGELVFEDSTSGNAFAEVTPIQLTDTTFGFLNLSAEDHFIRLAVELGDCDVIRDTIRVIVNPLPVEPEVAFVDGIGEVCQGDGINMEITNFQTGMFWNDQGMSATQTLGTDGSGMFFASFTENGCTSTSEVLNAVVNPNPVPEITRNVPSACSGDTLRIFIQNGFTDVKWDIDTEDSLKNEIRVFEDGTYTVSVTDENGCMGSNSESVTFFPKPSVPTIDQLDPDPACAGGTVRLVASYDVSGMWNEGTIDDTLFVQQTGSFTYISVSDNGCSTPAADTLDITFFDAPQAANVRVTPEEPYCNGDEVFLISEFANNNVWNDGSTNDTLIVTTTGSYFVETQDDNGCTARSRVIDLTFGDFPQQPEILQQGDTLTSSIAANVYEWLLNNAPLNKNKRTIVAQANGRYELRIYNGFGCPSNFSDPVDVSGVGIRETLAEAGIKMYPNPTNTGGFTLHAKQPFNYAIYTTDGRVVNEGVTVSGNNRIQLPQQGYYLVKLMSETQQFTVPVIYR